MSTNRKDPFPHLAGKVLADSSAADLAQLFKVLANDTRLRLLHVIHLGGEVSPSEIAEGVGASQQAVSNQLQRLADQRIVHARREGQRVLYRIIDPCVPGLMDLGVCLLSQRRSADRTPRGGLGCDRRRR